MRDDGTPFPENYEAFYEARSQEKRATSDNPEMSALIRRIASWCGIQAGERVLDYGCYDGYTLDRLARFHQRLGVGVDISHTALRQATDLYGGQRTRFVCSDGAGLPFGGAAFDVGVCSEILEHVPDLDVVLAELARVIRPGGRLYATMPNRLRDVWPPLRPVCRTVDEVEGHLRRMSRGEFEATLESHGFVVQRSHYRGFAASALWYRMLIYSPQAKARALSAVDAPNPTVATFARRLAFAGMHAYLRFDGCFSRFRGCMGIDVVAKRSAILEPSHA